jgi:hypothetical protein
METQELARYDMTETAMSPETVVKQVNLIQQVMRQAMREGDHFGVIPGCQKPSLLKAGAEKLSLTFRLAPGYEVIQTNGDSGHREYRVNCILTHIPTGQVFGQGVGICSTMESKYRYRGGEKIGTGQPVPKEYWNLKRDGKMDQAQALIGGRGYQAGKVEGVWQICEIGEKAENPDIADTYNTVLKMAKKRAHVDAVLTATAASDIFTQDVEDMQEPPPTTTPPETKQPEPGKKSEKPDPNKPAILSQTNAIGTLLTHLGIMDDMARAKRVSDILGLTETITDTKKLTYGQAVTVIEVLGKEVK